MSVLNVERPDFMKDEEIAIFEDSIGKFFDDRAPEKRVAKWREDGVVERGFWKEAAEAGILCLSMPKNTAAPAATIATRSCSWSNWA